ncbi:MAG: D-alanyl-D-alanine carboxypeptidase [Lachnospiraceae bacterium]|nr:D-alanyl-D-alanine carboxypeptidase [Clostridiales bacterium]MCC8142388.1 D-alanyl-D-alanine carboxypeptidase [Lachnospiraceae bacterium]
MKIVWKKIIAFCMAAAVFAFCVPAVSTLAEEVSEETESEELVTEDNAEEAEAQAELEEEAEEIDDGEPKATAPAADSAWPAGPAVFAEGAIVIDADTGTVLYAKNADEVLYPASITKIMTTLLALENSSMDETVVFSEDAVMKNEGNTSHIARDVDEEMTMEQTLYAVMLESANECAYAVAEHVGNGDYQSFIDMMNERAAALGCTNTHFTNANGLPDDDHYTTCRDMALIAQEAIKNDEFREIIGTLSYVIPPTNKHDEETYLNNHDKMINPSSGTEHIYEYCIGGKTGYTVAAGNTLVSYAEKDGRLLISVVMKTTAPYDDSIAILDFGFDDFQTLNIAQSETRFNGTSDVEGETMIFDGDEVYARLDPDAELVLPNEVSFDETDVEVSYDDASDSVLGTLVYFYDGREAGRADVLLTGEDGKIYVNEELNEAPEDEDVGTARSESRGWTTGMKVGVVLVIVVAVIVIIFVVAAVRARRRRRRRRRNAKRHHR